MNLYGLIADLRREHPTAEASRTLDMVAEELGRTRDNLRLAVANLEERPLPPGGKEVLAGLAERSRRYGIDDLDYGPAPEEVVYEPLDESTLGIGVILAVSSLVAVGLAGLAVLMGLNQILNLGLF